MKVLFFSPYDLPNVNITRNFDLAQFDHDLVEKVDIIVNNYDIRKRVRVRDQKNLVFKENLNQKVTVYWLNTYRHNTVFGRMVSALQYLILAQFLAMFTLRKSDILIGDTVPLTSAFQAVLTAKLLGKKSIVQIRDVWPFALVADGAIKDGSLTYKILRILETVSYSHSSGIITTLPNVITHISRVSSFPGELVKYLPNPYTISDYVVKNSSPTEHRSFKVIYAGGMGNAHDLLGIVRAASLLNNSKMQFSFEIYGDGPKRLEAERLVEELGISNFEFHGSVSKSELAGKISRASCCIATVTQSEAYIFGVNLNKLYDYMACSKPVVLAIDAPSDPVSLSGCGLVVPAENYRRIADALLQLSQLNLNELEAMGNAGNDYLAKNHSLTFIGNEFYAYLRMIKDNETSTR